MRLFGQDIIHVFQKCAVSVEGAIAKESEDYILNVNEEDFIAHVIQSGQLEPAVLHWDEVSATSYEKEFVETDRFDRDEQFKIKRQVFQYFIPVSGDRNLLGYHQARTITVSGFSTEGIFKDNCLILEFVQRATDIAVITRKFEETKSEIVDRYNKVVGDIEKFNTDMAGHARAKFNERKQRILHQKNQLAALGVPIRKANASSTFSVPKPTIRQKIQVRPVVTEKGFKTEPALEEADYNLILKYISDVGKNFESLPSLYKGKREEHLRDHILLVLGPNFEMGSATGETFNNKGKTDIMLSYDGQAVFIAECKYWTGEKGFSETIDQLLSYLTWRNSKASIVMFVKEKDFSSVIQKAVDATKAHPNYLGFVGKSNDSWFNFRMHINGDKNRELKLAVQLFHLPK